MNRKIFTLLAVALMLLSTAYFVSARSVAERSIGGLVSTLIDENGDGFARGMYHIRVDSIYCGSTLGWLPVSYEAGGTGNHIVWDAANKRFALASLSTDPYWGDTIILAAMETGQVKMISARDLRDSLSANPEGANLNDLQASMWCIGVEDPIRPTYGDRPTFYFTNRIFDLDLDFPVNGDVYVNGDNKGWMYSDAYRNGMLGNKLPLRRHESGTNYLVITAQLGTAAPILNLPTGFIRSTQDTIHNFLNETINGMIKVSIVKVSPFVLNATDFNTILGYEDGKDPIQLNFDPEPQQDNKFGYYLKAYPSDYAPANALDYLNVEAFRKVGDSFVSDGFIYNDNRARANAPDKYNNSMTEEFLNIKTTGPNTNPTRTNDTSTANTGGYNYSYRFVYFPSEDSLVINAYFVDHRAQATYGTNTFIDNGVYESDALMGTTNHYYGFYNDEIFWALIVHYQDINGIDGPSSMITIGKPDDLSYISFGKFGCNQLLIDAWLPSRGVYTIWDSRGRALGIRIYNGSYTPQWMELDPTECPDRIPAYQWVVEPVDNGDKAVVANNRNKSRVKITNREFGNTVQNNELVQMVNVLIKRGYSQIFRPFSQFLYEPLVPEYRPNGGYEPINYGWVKGEYLPVIVDKTACGTGGFEDYSGFRPVNSDYLRDPYLGYKHFPVFKDDPDHPSFGKSEDTKDEKGMDYNAYAFNWFSYLGENVYIDFEENVNNETLLKAKNGSMKGFQFLLPQKFEGDQYEEEVYGYIRSAWSSNTIRESDPAYYNPNYTQERVPILRRYYYELKEADFYKYRDGWAEKFVVLKGAKNDGTDIRNAMKYGVDDIWSEKHPFKKTNIYLRESFFKPDADFKTPKPNNEYRNVNDPTRRVFYVILDRIEREQIDRVQTLGGLEVSDSLTSSDGSQPYSLVSWDVHYVTQLIQARGKTVSDVNVSSFTLENVTYPLYRRLRSKEHDGAITEPLEGMWAGTSGLHLDGPKVLRFFRDRGPEYYLFEDAMSQYSANYGINFLGLSNIDQNKEIIAPDGTVKYNYNMFVDTAFINRGTGPIKPQYLLAVGVDIYDEQPVCYVDDCLNVINDTLEAYIYGRYLVNATDSARKVGSDGSKDYDIRDMRYIYDTNWDRLVFVEAIHAHDRLYILSEVRKYLDDADWIYESCNNGGTFYDVRKLREATRAGGKLAGKERLWNNSKMLGAYYDFGNWDNYHNDVTFSLRFRQWEVQNPDANGVDTYSNDAKRFYIESETTNRTPYGNRKIAPVQGGWISLHNWVPVLSRTSYEDPIQQAEVWNVDKNIGWQDGKATSNEILDADFAVIADFGAVNILNAAGKQVTVTNMLGQTLVKKALTGNNETVAVSKGIAIVTVEGEKAVKVIIK